VGPGAEAASVEVQLSDASPAVGDTVDATAIVRDGAGAELSDVPVDWRSSEPEVRIDATGVAGGRATARLVATAEGVTASIAAELPSGLAASSQLETEAELALVELDLMMPGYRDPYVAEAHIELLRDDGSVAADTVVGFPDRMPGSLDPVRHAIDVGTGHVPDHRRRCGANPRAIEHPRAPCEPLTRTLKRATTMPTPMSFAWARIPVAKRAPKALGFTFVLYLANKYIGL